MQQQMSVITLGVHDLARSRRFYVDGFGWAPVFENEDIVFFQMNGLHAGLWKAAEITKTHGARKRLRPGAFALAECASGVRRSRPWTR
jgi:hypothetical protein